jgi:hypothetical protein
MNASFKDRQTAYIWGKYQELILREADNFGAQPEDMYTIQDVMTAKYGEGARETKESIGYFQEIMCVPLRDLTYDKMMDHANMLMKKVIYRGGQGKNSSGRVSGTCKLPEIMTVLRKFAYLSSSINYMIKNGVNLTNNAAKVVLYLRDLEKYKSLEIKTRIEEVG